MINPQMMGMGMNGQLPKSPTVKELWKNEKEKYRHWMILFGIGMLVVFGLLLASIITNASSSDAIKTSMTKYINENYAGATLEAALAGVASSFRMKYIIMPALQVALVGIGLILFIVTVIQSYQNKTFARLSPWSTMVMGVGAFISVYQLFSLIWNGAQASFDTTGGVFQFITYILTLAIWFSGASQVSRIRRQFAFATRIEALQNSPEFKAMQEQMKAMQNGQSPAGFANGPFGPMMNNPMGGATMGANTNQTPTPQAAPVEPTKSDERKSLESMTITDLKKVAKKLSISGIAGMKKTELIESILRVTENN